MLIVVPLVVSAEVRGVPRFSIRKGDSTPKARSKSSFFSKNPAVKVFFSGVARSVAPLAGSPSKWMSRRVWNEGVK
jgi:hypothetical protein